MKKRLFFLLPFVLLAFILQSCKSGSDSSIIAGQVIEEANGAPIQDALVEITSPENLAASAETDSSGSFSFDVNIAETANITLEVSKPTYQTATTKFKIGAGKSVDDLTIRLTSEDSGGDDGGGDDGVGGEAGGAHAIELTSLSRTSINIAETGGITNASFTFVVRDSAGRAINLDHSEEVAFSIIENPNGVDASITPEVVTTNADGKATSNISAGKIAGVVKIQALIQRSDINVAIRSKPVAIAIHGGFPYADRTSMSVEKSNFEGLNFDGVRDQITVIVGDKYSNPVKPGTAVYFETTAGIIQGSNTRHTDEDGFVTVDLISGGDRSLLNNHPTLGYGYAEITASTFNEADQKITKKETVLFSGGPTYNDIELTPAPFSIAANSSVNFSLTVTDENDNPLPAGTTVSIEVAEGLEITGGGIEIPNALLPGPGVTDFEFTVADVDDEKSNTQGTQITITVETPKGVKVSRSFSGDRSKTR
ncbi:carboxypeptidase-like regulatory domain-containing protein [Fodinibius saliphilus]|uniref:carboxypeptidase-like regulatory domain-containing protein n=1 Tax=Fodinibius saliphilus TaxID=1920650 RepID=UPI0011093247|nr:carboxypeptidase-like regulatory domain-containing protein [Fodinibius saliphilus]